MRKEAPLSARIRILLLVTIAGGAYFVPHVVFGRQLPDRAAVQAFLLGLGALAPIAFVAFSVLRGFVLFPPNSTMYVISGFVFGPVYGALYALVGAVACSIVQFAVARYLGLAVVQGIVGNKRKMPELTVLTTFSAVMLIRMMIFGPPFDLVNYGLGLTAVSWRNYVLGTSIGLIPSIVLFTQFGSALSGQLSPRALAVAGVISAAAAGILVMRYLRERSARAHRLTEDNQDGEA